MTPDGQSQHIGFLDPAVLHQYKKIDTGLSSP